jgi:hypothetical protein
MADNLKAAAYAAGLTPEQKREIDIISKKMNKVLSSFNIHEMKNNRTSLIAIASPRPQYRSLSRFSEGSLSAKIVIKITLSIPRMTSKMMRVMSGTKNSI